MGQEQQARKRVKKEMEHLKPQDDLYPGKRETEEETLLEKILRIPLIADSLWGHFTSEELRLCRFVNWAWKESATAELVRRNLAHLQFSCRQGAFSLVRTRWGLAPIESLALARFRVEEAVCLQDLFQSLKRGKELESNKTRTISSYNFPCSSFTFTDGNFTAGEDLTAFLDRHGEMVRTLCLERIHLSVQILLPMFTGQLRNLRKLSLVSVKPVLDRNWKAMELPGNEPNNESLWTLPFLTTVNLEDPQLLPFLIRLMKSAPNLKFIGNLPLHPQLSKTHPFFSNSWIQSKLSLIVGLVISWTDEESENLSALEAFHLQLPNNRIRILTLDHPAGALPPPDAGRHLLHILQQNALSLRVVHATFSRIFYSLFDNTPLVILPNVEHLTVDVGKGAGEQFDAALILKIFPNLSSIYLRFTREMIAGHEPEDLENGRGRISRKGNINWSDYFTTSLRFPPNPVILKTLSFPTVIKLETLGHFPTNWFKPLVQLFPHVQTVLMNVEMQYKWPDYPLANGKWLQLKHLFYGTVAMATPVKKQHETFVLSLS